MGSHLSGIAPAQILSADNYFVELPEFQFESSLGSTRFLKVARAKHKEGYVVIKVFVIHDPSIPLQPYQEELSRIGKSVSGFPNVLPFQRSVLTDRAGLLIRQFVHDNLYDRISTRPFLSIVEKKWIVFQVLCALEQMHSVKVCHGDIKTENIMVTSWNWVQLTDIASFKPVFLPLDNPADFNYFFDTSRRRTCCLAPERFIDSRTRNLDLSNVIYDGENKKEQVGTMLPMQGVPTQQFELTEAMDIFSVGCVVGELFCDGASLFDLSQLLAYRLNDFHPEVKIQKINESIKDMIMHMIQMDPSKRLTAKEYMTKYRGSIFPEEFYSFLKSYLSGFVGLPIITADEKIAKLVKDMDLICSSLCHKYALNTKEAFPNVAIETVTIEKDERRVPETDNCFVMIVSLVISCVRSLKFCISKLNALDLLLKLSYYVTDEIILELILPYMFFLVTDSIPRVRAHSITAITKCLQIITILPKNEANIFPEYILPNLSQLVNDPEVIVQCAFAENISSLAETALRFLELAQLSSINNNDRDDQIQYQVSYDVELHALHELIQNKVVALLTNSDSVVKRTLMENGLTRLCVFFGRQKANDVLLSHIITFLNDKHDWQLRAAFFDSIVGIAVYIGWHCLSILKPLLQQGLKDTEEFVVVRALQALTSLVDLGLLQKPIITEMLIDVVPFVSHPNQWIRYASVGYIVACAKKMPLVDVHCRLMPLVLPYLKQPIIQLVNQTVLLSVLVDPIPRNVYDYIVRSPQTRTLLARLELHHQDNKTMFNPSNEDPLSQITRKLKSQGMTAEIEEKIIRLKEIILKLNVNKINPEMHQTQDLVFPGLLDLSSLNIIPKSKEIDLSRMVETKADPIIQSAKRPVKISQQTLQGPLQIMTNLEVDYLNNDCEDKGVQKVEDQSSRLSTLTDQAKFAQCKQDVRTLSIFKCEQYVSDLKRKNLLNSLTENRGKQTGWKPKGQLVAHLHEHKAAINRVITNEDYSFFVTASDDSTVKIWDTQKLDGKGWTTRSKFTYTKQIGKINCLTFCQNSTTLACSSDDASIHVFRIDTNAAGNNVPLLIEKKLDVQEDGRAVDMQFYDTGSQWIITYATVHGYMCGWDLRLPKDKYAWKLKNDLTLGLITSYVIDPLQCWITCGTSDGALVCWDMRFQLPITKIIHPRNACVRRLACHALESSWVAASFHGNNEVSMWDLETAAKRQTLWASQYPPLSHSQVSNDTVLTMRSMHQGSKTFFITAGTDKRIRYWDLREPEQSGIIVGSATDNLDNVQLIYNNRMIDGTEVIYETYEKRRLNYEDRPRKDEASIGHHDCITDIATTKSPQNFLITSSMNGVIKVWK
ncbi:phosphoinositide 3-kinase regulatory subunit 4 isoform X1 [Hydra vulgaris]|uniref:phosphoinositide 3-kinase regulatory subunit 4 isoform X1 n=1 Tax=Hydra vulgaris TaxID=6087 RepID=UPI001F5FC751|nr:phosphoinositide 3-kinase regulatory subunit 4-like [Hydra vulgaris]